VSDLSDSDEPELKTQVVNVVYGGRWRVDGRLGAGGMGNVFRGTDLQTNEAVAIKTLGMHLVDNAEFVKRFEREAQLISRLTHPALPRFRELARQDGIPYFVMTLVEGRPLGELLIDGKKVSSPFAFALLGQLAGVLTYLHGQGVVHRDLKPDNLMVDANGRLSLVDFGISAQTNLTRLTLPGVTVGTPLYMAPEAITTGHTTPLSDVYAMGLLAFTMLTGAHPFAKEERAGMLTRQVTEVPASAAIIDPSVGERAARVISRALEKTPAARYQSAPEFVEALREAWGFEAVFGDEKTDEGSGEFLRNAMAPTVPSPRRSQRAFPPADVRDALTSPDARSTVIDETTDNDPVSPVRTDASGPLTEIATGEHRAIEVDPPAAAGPTTRMVVAMVLVVVLTLLLAVVFLR
jgi:serine/threonine protein kinase